MINVRHLLLFVICVGLIATVAFLTKDYGKDDNHRYYFIQPHHPEV